MTKLTDNQKLLVVAGAAVLLSGIGGGGVWWAKGLVQEKVDSIDEMRTQIQAAQAKIRKIPKVEQDVIILRENLYEYVKMLPEQTEVNDFLRVTQNFQSQSQVEMSSFQPGRPTRGKSPFEQYSYKFRIKATLWQFMHFMSLFEDYERFVQVKDFSLSGGSARDALNGHDVVHQFNMTVETYVYRGSAGGSDVQIANYTHKVEKLREEIFEARQTIAKQGYKFQGQRGRRDIFVDPRESAMDRENGPRGAPVKQQREIIDTLATLLADCEGIYSRLQDPSITIFDKYSLERRLRQQLTDLDSKVKDVNDKALISHAPLRLTWNREVIEPLARLTQQAEASGASETSQRWLTQEEMNSVMKRMGEDLKAGDILAAMERYDSVEDRIRVEQSDYRYKTYVKIESLYLRAKLAEEFGGLMLDISGICVNDDGKSGVILNGTVYEEGEYVDDQLLIKAVARDRVEFVYKGFTVVKTR